MKRIKFKHLLILLITLSAGCTNPVVRDIGILKNQKETAKTFSEITPINLARNKVQNFEVSHNDPRMSFEGQVTYANLFRLPKSDQPYIMTIRSKIQGHIYDTLARVYYPTVLLLDENFHVEKRISPEVDIKRDGCCGTVYGYIVKNLQIHPDKTMYMVIYSPRSKLNDTFNFSGSYAPVTGPWLEHEVRPEMKIGRWYDVKWPHSPVGPLEIHVH